MEGLVFNNHAMYPNWGSVVVGLTSINRTSQEAYYVTEDPDDTDIEEHGSGIEYLSTEIRMRPFYDVLFKYYSLFNY